MSYERELDYEINLLKQTEEIATAEERCSCKEPWHIAYAIHQLVGRKAFDCEECGLPQLKICLADRKTGELHYLEAAPGRSYRIVKTLSREQRQRRIDEILERARARRDAAMRTGCNDSK